MKRHTISNVLLVELLIVLMFFMLSSTILIRVFAASRIQSDRAIITTRALAKAQNVADTLYAADDAETALIETGFIADGERWTLECDGYRLSVNVEEDRGNAGTLKSYDVRAVAGEKELFVLPVARYTEARP